MNNEITTLSIKETAKKLQKGEISSTEITKAYLERIGKLNPRLNAYITVTQETALADAKASDARKKKLGPLDGVPIAIKDNISTVGTRTTAASKMLENFISPFDATVIQKLKKAGAVVLGKTNLDEFAMGSSTENSAFGPSKNPWDAERVPGGSSGGSAVAVAADLCAGAIGSDTGGSIRQPASFCGVVGLKPTYGAVSRYGLIAMASSFDQIGPITKTVEDAKVVYEAIAGTDPFDATSSEPLKQFAGKKQYRIGLPKEFFGEGLDADVRRVIEQAIKKLEDLGHEVHEVSLPHIPYALAAYYIIVPVEVSSNLARYDGIKYGLRVDGETLYDVYANTRAAGFGAEAKRRIMLGSYTSSTGYIDQYYVQAKRVQAQVKEDFDKAFEDVDLLATPVSPTPAFKIGEKIDDPLKMYLGDVMTVPINPAGLAAMSVPAGFSGNLPVGLQLIGPQWSEPVIFDVANQFEEAVRIDRKPKL